MFAIVSSASTLWTRFGWLWIWSSISSDTILKNSLFCSILTNVSFSSGSKGSCHSLSGDWNQSCQPVSPDLDNTFRFSLQGYLESVSLSSTSYVLLVSGLPVLFCTTWANLYPDGSFSRNEARKYSDVSPLRSKSTSFEAISELIWYCLQSICLEFASRHVLCDMPCCILYY